MFMKLELWQDNGTGKGPGVIAFSGVSAKAAPIVRPINAAAIVSFERVAISTVGRLNSNENKTDHLTGVRISVADGTTWLVLDGRDNSFESHFAKAISVRDAVLDCGSSTYVETFGSRG